MKKLLACVLALVMVLSLSVTAFAADINQGSAEQKGTTNVTYTVNPTYTVTIPATVTLGNDMTVSASNVVVPKGKQVVVKLIAEGGADAFSVKTAEGAELYFAVKKGNEYVTVYDTVLTVNPDDGASGSTSLSFVLNDTIQYAGNYSGTVTFTVSVKDVPTNG